MIVYFDAGVIFMAKFDLNKIPADEFADSVDQYRSDRIVNQGKDSVLSVNRSCASLVGVSVPVD